MKISSIYKIVWEIDNEDKVLDYKLHNGLSFWLLIRYDIFKMLLNKPAEPYLRSKNIFVDLAKKVNNRILHLKYLQKNKRHHPLNFKDQFDCINICSSLGTISSANGHISRISGFLSHFSEIKTLNVIAPYNKFYHNNYAGDYCFFDGLLLKNDIVNKRMRLSPHEESNSNYVSCFIDLLKKHLKEYFNDKNWQDIKERIIYFETASKHLEVSVKIFLQQTKPKLVVIEDGNYGSLENCTFIKVANEMKIPTVEIQHGVFDIAFQYTKKLISNPAFASQKTNYVLTFGEYFSQFVQSSSQNISIGNYYMENKKNLLLNEAKTTTPIILFITQKKHTDEIIGILNITLKKIGKPFKLIIRLHPVDADNRDKYKLLQQFEGTEFSINEDVHSQLIKADYIIGSYSTLLFESLYFGKIPLIHKNDLSDHFVPNSLGLVFANPQELQNLLERQVAVTDIPKRADYFWALDCVNNFKKFYIQKILK